MRAQTTLALLSLLLLAGRVDAAPPFTDGDFMPTDWEIVVFSFKSSGGAFPGGAVTASQEPGGYPGTLRKVNDSIIAAPSASEYSSTWGVHLKSGAVWDPMTQGPIGTLDYDEDAFLFAPNGDGQLTGAFPIALDAVALDRLLDLGEVAPAQAFEPGQFRAEPIGPVGEAVGQARRAESPVAAGGGVTAESGLDQDHVPLGIALLGQ